jgi:hypothetical protein
VGIEFAMQIFHAPGIGGRYIMGLQAAGVDLLSHLRSGKSQGFE